MRRSHSIWFSAFRRSVTPSSDAILETVDSTCSLAVGSISERWMVSLLERTKAVREPSCCSSRKCFRILPYLLTGLSDVRARTRFGILIPSKFLQWIRLTGRGSCFRETDERAVSEKNPPAALI